MKIKKNASLKTVLQRLDDKNYIYEVKTMGNNMKLYPDKMQHMEMYVYGVSISPYEVTCPYATGKTKRVTVWVGMPIEELEEIYKELRVEKGSCVSLGWLTRQYGTGKAEQICACCSKVGWFRGKGNNIYAFA